MGEAQVDLSGRTVPAPRSAAPDGASTSAREDGEARPPAEGAEAPAPVAGGWVPSALHAAASGYRQTYGAATDLSGDDQPAVRVRWVVPWRLAASAATVVALVVGATLIRATALAPGDPVDLPTPATGTATAAPDGGDDSAGAGLGASPAAPSDRSAQVVVHVVGAVTTPGVVHLAAGARVQDAITAAGGALAVADLSALNLARVVLDGEQVVVPRPGEAPAATTAPGGAAVPGRLDLNAAALADLDGLPGIGPVLAQRILDRRQQHRFTSVDELGEVAGIGPALLQRLRPLVRV